MVLRNPDKPITSMEFQPPDNSKGNVGKKVKRISSPEKWEIKQVSGIFRGRQKLSQNFVER